MLKYILNIIEKIIEINFIFNHKMIKIHNCYRKKKLLKLIKFKLILKGILYNDQNYRD